MEPDTPGTRARRYTTLGTGALFAGALTYIGLGDPHRPGFLFPHCPFKLLTGWDCPFCGGLRMTHDVLHADFAAAVTDNIFALVGLPALALWILFRWRRKQPVLPVPAIAVVIVATIAWAVVRNLPGFPLVPTLLEG